MSTRKDQDEPFVSGEGGADTLPEATPMRVSSSDVPPSPPAPRPVRPGEGGGDDDDGTRGRGGFFQRVSDFIRDTRAEMHRVSWPSANQVKNTTIITIIAVIFFAAYLFVVDRAWTLLIEGLTSLLGRIA